MFAIVDIETCGTKFGYPYGRIIEIAIVIHDGLQVTERFSTLINPRCHISGYYSNISGITNDMIADAPQFHQVAKKIIELTEDRIFVAHNAGFDYSFIKKSLLFWGTNSGAILCVRCALAASFCLSAYHTAWGICALRSTYL